MNDSMSEMLLVGLSQSEWEQLMSYLGKIENKDRKEINIIIRKLLLQIF